MRQAGRSQGCSSSALLCVFPLYFLMSVGPVAGAQIALELDDATAAQAIRAVARAGGKGLVSSPLSEQAQALQFEGESLGLALEKLRHVYDMHVAEWRGLLVAEARTPMPSLAGRLQAALTQEQAELLFRPRDGGAYESPGFGIIVEAVKVLAKEGHTAANRPLLERAALWRAAPELDEHLSAFEAATAGHVLVQIAAPEAWEKERGDPCNEHLLLLSPGAGDPEDVLGVRTGRFHARGYDRFEETLKAERAVIGRDELVRRLVERARTEEDPFPNLEGLRLPVNLVYQELTVGGLAQRLSRQTGLAIEPDAELAQRRVVVEAKDLAVYDLLRAVARAISGTVAFAEAEQRVAITKPEAAIERLDAALPVELWALANLTSIEADLWCQEHVDAAWTALTADTAERLRQEPVRLDALPAAVFELARYHFARNFRRWTANLPLRDAPVPLWLYEHAYDPRFAGYELRAPGGSEWIAGLGYLLMRAELTGEKTFVIPVPEEGGQGR